MFARKLFFGGVALLTLAAPASTLLHAQQDGPPNVLVIQREYLKPGKGGMMHDRSESAFVHAAMESKSPNHYFALDSLSGPSRALYFFSYNSFADWEKANAELRENKTLGEAIDHAQAADGDLLSSYDSTALALRPDLSLNHGSIQGTRYFEITSFVVKPGHLHEFEELAHMYMEGFRKASPDTHWDTFQSMYGSGPIQGVPMGNSFVVINTMKSMAEIDKANADFKKFTDQVGAEGMKKIAELEAASVETTTTNLFAINPQQSYPRQEWVDKEPGFWKVAR